jgi:hypothetical protein
MVSLHACFDLNFAAQLPARPHVQVTIGFTEQPMCLELTLMLILSLLFCFSHFSAPKPVGKNPFAVGGSATLAFAAAEGKLNGWRRLTCPRLGLG